MPTLTVISPEKTSFVEMARDFVRYRELLLLLTWREVSVRYSQTVAGLFWVVLQPVLSALIFAFVFGRLVNMPSDGLPYLLFAYCGTLVWGLFAQGIDRAAGSIVADEQLIRKVYFPRWIIPMASVGSAVLDFAVCLLLLAAFLLFYQVAPTWNLLLIVPASLLVLALATAMGIATAALNARYRDFKLLVSYGLQIGQFLSPVFYSLAIVPREYLGLMYLNPMAGPIELFRLALTGTSHFLPGGFALSFAVDLGVIAISVTLFHALEDDIVDTI